MCSTVQTEAPVNLTYMLMDAGGHEMGHNALLSWTYPVPSDLQYGWITLVYELQYRQVTEPDNWKVGGAVRESPIRSNWAPDLRKTSLLLSFCKGETSSA